MRLQIYILISILQAFLQVFFQKLSIYAVKRDFFRNFVAKFRGLYLYNVKIPQIIVFGGVIVDLTLPVVMAIVNATPDSFYAGSRHVSADALMLTVDKAVADGAAILDVGGCSTRPGTAVPSAEEEWRRVSWALSLIRAKYPDFPISVDTFRASVAERAVVEFGVGMINDISGGELDADLLPTMARLQVPYVLMHSKGTPQTMQQLTDYDDLIPDMLRYFADKIALLRRLGFDKEIVIDPGFGFAKTVEQNFELLRHLRVFGTFDLPVLAGISRKSMLYKTLDVQPESALNGTTAANMLALVGGASILRVHDVREAVETIKIYERTLVAGVKL